MLIRDAAPNGRTAAHVLVEALVSSGVDHVFCVPGESYISVLDALADHAARIRVVTCRHEAGAANMAEAYGKMTGRPGICMVTRGPGATHAAVGVHTAQHDSTPMILFVGQIARGHKGRGAFQEVDYPAVFGALGKWAVEIDDPGRVDEIVYRAFSTAQSGRPGPVIVALPEDMLLSPAEPGIARQAASAASGLDPVDASSIALHLERAERPLLILGGGGWSREALDALAGWADAASLPVILSFRRKDLLDNRHRCYIGDLGFAPNRQLVERVRQSDLVLAIGARLGDTPTQGYTLLTREKTSRSLIHIYPGASEIGRVWPALMGAVADVSQAAMRLARRPIGRQWPDWRSQARAEFEAFVRPVAVSGTVNLSEVFAELRRALPDDAIVANGAGNYAAWLHRFFLHHGPNTQLAPTSGAMGYGLPAAIAAKLLHPERDVVAVAGDGCFLMLGQELATAVQYGANIFVLVIDNSSYGTIRMHQERVYPGRVIATDLQNPDFVAFARAFGAWATRVDRTEAFSQALAEARAADRPALIHIKTSLEDISPGSLLRGVRAQLK
jgi:acetolactate synthase-1/2/3 large subunit